MGYVGWALPHAFISPEWAERIAGNYERKTTTIRFYADRDVGGGIDHGGTDGTGAAEHDGDNTFAPGGSDKKPDKKRTGTSTSARSRNTKIRGSTVSIHKRSMAE